ncbi:MAG: glutamate--cysteine ligase, partial [Gammaproteobacteria bacterium]
REKSVNLDAEQIVERLSRNGSEGFSRGLKGLEKESLRVHSDGGLSKESHPIALGSALTHPMITTDYSEALLEFVTKARDRSETVVEELSDIHRFVYRNLDDELLWVTSMPCVLAADDAIPIANYGSSNVGRMKHIYRVGLGYRYGRAMQAIAGVHFNYSPPEALWSALAAEMGEEAGSRTFKDQRFMGMVRNLKRTSWLVSYLFGASPAVCKSFVRTGGAGLRSFDQATWFYPHGTSLRLSEFGYSNRTVGGISVGYSSLDDYVTGLRHATDTPHPPYQRIGVKEGGEYRQLNANLLQIENEYYSYVRPKRSPAGNEKRTTALAERGIEYIELRSLDLNPWDPCGISENSIRFLEAYALHALLASSSPISEEEDSELTENLIRVAARGRETGLQLERDGEPVALIHWGAQLLDAIAPVCDLLDGNDPDRPYSSALAEQRVKLEDPSATPSARVLREMRDHGETFFHFAMRRSEAMRQASLDDSFDPEVESAMQKGATESVSEQKRLESSDTIGFDEYLRQYFAQP